MKNLTGRKPRSNVRRSNYGYAEQTYKEVRPEREKMPACGPRTRRYGGEQLENKEEFVWGS